MPRRDGTGPMGQGSMTGRRMGFCNTNNVDNQDADIARGAGMGTVRGSGSGMGLGRGSGMGLGRGAGMGRRGGACNSMRKRCFRGFGRGM